MISEWKIIFPLYMNTKSYSYNWPKTKHIILNYFTFSWYLLIFVQNCFSWSFPPTISCDTNKAKSSLSNIVTTMEITISVTRMFILFKQKIWTYNSQHSFLLLPSPNKCWNKLLCQSCCVKCNFTIRSSGWFWFFFLMSLLQQSWKNVGQVCIQTMYNTL